MSEHHGMLHNRARLSSPDTEPKADELAKDEYMVFALKDQHHQFTLGLETVLQCMKFAEQEGVVPSLPEEWWLQVSSRYQNID
ncbi:hypothetical protein L861_06435 [Litchfieldella anticariensis FP35 = DSM 16096]|uniref:Uncharacterized protein n=1 Tax=Litchfieldella anticariensis (strain DSM 16096 / CECT 5854 / CIP 108499 / LMG 22089 / FP35) TaxID=1121939 RepID=S2L766_LITA3|nr:hypothetical protein [Halomonas anticariensis]EPC00571.1 hypothetical protein L861_06435 [Halomonas anticariensis FP35 = DSM 16096]